MTAMRMESCGGLGPLAESVGDIVDERIGIVHHVEEVPSEPGTPDFFHYAAKGCDTAAFSTQSNFNNTGGAAIDREVAMAKAIGEAIERYCAALYDLDGLPLTSARDASFAVVPPEHFALYSEAQYNSDGFPWVAFNDDTTVRWTPAKDLISGDTVHVPAALAWIPYTYYQGSGDAPIAQPISTGLACHGSWARAALSGLCEVIERDAFTIMWQGRLSCPQLRVETLSDANYDLVRRFEVCGDKVILLDLTFDHGVPCVLSVLRSERPQRPAFVFAASAEADPELAVRKALEELAHTRRYSQQIKARLEPVSADDDFEQVQTQVDHLNFAADHERAGDFDFVFASKQRVSFDEMPSVAGATPTSTLENIVQRIADVGHRVYVADLTSPDVRGLGLTVVRTLVPGFHPLFMGHRLRALGGTRLWSVPARMGHPPADPSHGDNPLPHPYP